MAYRVPGVRRPDPAVGRQFLMSSYAPGERLALLSKSNASGKALQRIRPVEWFVTDHVGSWLVALNRRGWDHYISVNAIKARQRTRCRATIGSVRHLFLDADRDGRQVLDRIANRHDLPVPSYVIRTSADRYHILWRVAGFVCEQAEVLQRQLARELHTDTVATSCAQLTRLVGYHNHKYTPAPIVTVDYGRHDVTYGPEAFPSPVVQTPPSAPPARAGDYVQEDLFEGARRYLAAIPPAIAGQHGDIRTFQVCCRLVRGFALSDGDALDLLTDWNARCEPPWTASELKAKIRHARSYGREPVGGLLGAPRRDSRARRWFPASHEDRAQRTPTGTVIATHLTDAAPTQAPRGPECSSSSHASRQCVERCPTVPAEGDTV